MSSEHESGFTGPQGAQPTGGHDAVGPAPDRTAQQPAVPSDGVPPASPAGQPSTAVPPPPSSYPPPQPPAPGHSADYAAGPSADYAAYPPPPAHSAPFGSGGTDADRSAWPPPGGHPFGAGHPVGGWTGPDHPGGSSTDGRGPRRKQGGLVALVAAVAIAAGGIGGGIGAWASGGSDSSSTASSTTVSSTVDKAALNRAPTSVAGIAAKALPSTVTIKAEGSQESGTGTGFVYDTEGHILTNNHVVAPAADGGKLTVKFSDGSSYAASVVGRAEGYDVAVVKLDNPPKDKLSPLPLGDSDKVAVGDATIAIGAPFGLEGTVTTGIVSAKDRPVASGDSTGAQASYMNALQTDASINPGNSGGPLLNAGGQVIGINSAIQSTSGGGGGNPFGQTEQAGSIGLGFAIPINQAKWVADTLIRTGQPVYAILGVLRNDNYNGDGAQIMPSPVQGTPAVTPDGPADKAGLKPGDVITKLDGVPIDSGPTLVSEIWSHRPGEHVQVVYTRNGETHTTTVTLGERKGDSK
ncbi:S1C family serine protease [Peterkaempfera bronchialis]|uniref:S1C family serine protease n=1 Tax=Peterkaempfera bronchialis TaxID=2126346 RepID=UPI001E607C3E|nr:trypsin-like peptidase domain-containing protein [Peterkaempfera bronchialis]